MASAGAHERPPSNPAPTTVPLKCESLQALHLAHTQIVSAEAVAAGSFKPPFDEPFAPPVDYAALPAFCRIIGSIHPTADSDIGFELWLPQLRWNGRFMQTGNGAAAGSIVYSSLAGALARGYAVANTDTGHHGAGGDFSWAAAHPQRLRDYAFRAVHELTVTGKAITAAAYRRAPAKSYWTGCSTGGRQGLKEAQRYPGDYDAVIAGAPANNWEPLMGFSMLIQRNLGVPNGLGLDKLSVLHEAALAACDAQDGVEDRVIGDPRRCGFDPSSLQCRNGNTAQCLTASEVSAAERIYRGVVSKSGATLMPGSGPASELQWAFYASPQFALGTSFFRYAVAHDPNWDPASLDVEAAVANAQRIDGGEFMAMDPDLRRFIAHGGRLIIYHGTTDGVIPFGNSVNYYQSLVARLGDEAVEKSVRLYVVPGMNHCGGGEGASVIDWLTALESWAELGQAPGALHGTHPPFVMGPPGTPPTPSKPFARPICAYPLVAKYRGSGDPDVAASFSCGMP